MLENDEQSKDSSNKSKRKPVPVSMTEEQKTLFKDYAALNNLSLSRMLVHAGFLYIDSKDNTIKDEEDYIRLHISTYALYLNKKEEEVRELIANNKILSRVIEDKTFIYLPARVLLANVLDLNSKADIEDEEDYIRLHISTYAKRIGKSDNEILKEIKDGIIKSVLVDNEIFIYVHKKELNKMFLNHIEDEEDYIRLHISTYANYASKTIEEIKKLIEDGKIYSVNIDNEIFIYVHKEKINSLFMEHIENEEDYIRLHISTYAKYTGMKEPAIKSKIAKGEIKSKIIDQKIYIYVHKEDNISVLLEAAKIKEEHEVFKKVNINLTTSVAQILNKIENLQSEMVELKKIPLDEKHKNIPNPHGRSFGNDINN